MKKAIQIAFLLLVVSVVVSCSNNKFPEPCDCAEILKVDNPELEKACMEKAHSLNRWQLQKWNDAVLNCNQATEE